LSRAKGRSFRPGDRMQAAMLAYNNDFKLLLALTLCAIPAVLLLRGAPARATGAVAIE